MPAFLDAVAALRDNHRTARGGRAEGAALDAASPGGVGPAGEDPELAWFLAEEEHVAQQAERPEGEAPTPTADSISPGPRLRPRPGRRPRPTRSSGRGGSSTWCPPLRGGLGARLQPGPVLGPGRGGYAISLAFQGAFLDPDSWTARTFRGRGPSGSLCARPSGPCRRRAGGGRAVQLTKNVLLPLEDGDPAPSRRRCSAKGSPATSDPPPLAAAGAPGSAPARDPLHPRLPGGWATRRGSPGRASGRSGPASGRPPAHQASALRCRTAPSSPPCSRPPRSEGPRAQLHVVGLGSTMPSVARRWRPRRGPPRPQPLDPGVSGAARGPPAEGLRRRAVRRSPRSGAARAGGRAAAGPQLVRKACMRRSWDRWGAPGPSRRATAASASPA